MTDQGGGQNNMQTMTPEQREQAFAMANQEMEYRVDLFNKLVHSCYEKCIDKRFKDGDLNVGETACVDRCSSKYWQSVGIVGQLLGANQQQQQQP
jgi:import inner membrane translocase subunit TIM10